MPKYNLELLTIITDRDSCEVDFNLYKNVSAREVKIAFRCECGTTAEKVFRQMYESGGYCEKCTKTRMRQKATQTFMSKYGVAHPMHSKIIQEKIKKLNQDKYGVDYPFQSKDIQDKAKETHLKRYGHERPLQVNEAKEKAKKTFQQNYNVDNPMKSTAIQEKAKKTNVIKYGVEHSFQSELVKGKIKETMIERYGVENPMLSNEIKQKSKNTNLEKYGVESHNQSDIVKEKKKQSTLHNFGVENPMQHPEIADKCAKNAFKYKEFVFPCGETRLVQGNEPLALNILIKQRYTPQDIVTEKTHVPEIWYISNESNHRYFPDIYIPQENRIIEVKSTWTYQKELEKNILKAEACKQAGYSFEFWIFDDKGNNTILV